MLYHFMDRNESTFRPGEINKNHLSGSNLKLPPSLLPRVEINELIGSCCFSDCSQVCCHHQKYKILTELETGDR